MENQTTLTLNIWEMIKTIEDSEEKISSVDLMFSCPNVVRYFFEKTEQDKKALVIS